MKETKQKEQDKTPLINYIIGVVNLILLIVLLLKMILL